ncbi:hypothetical protein FA15DRAFT_655313 [Coprinopsis marcescibilis]|uniref:Uncharacterized protein n=1 Tax=Coprinopsis marcescibilis TaxID=230819 RepID=A0A5C3KXE1_COPMA|nr:hypothetical protein FA15DRAFT_655313 [Coprinopsis marcescibilis]
MCMPNDRTGGGGSYDTPRGIGAEKRGWGVAWCGWPGDSELGNLSLKSSRWLRMEVWWLNSNSNSEAKASEIMVKFRTSAVLATKKPISGASERSFLKRESRRNHVLEVGGTAWLWSSFHQISKPILGPDCTNWKTLDVYNSLPTISEHKMIEVRGKLASGPQTAAHTARKIGDMNSESEDKVRLLEFPATIDIHRYHGLPGKMLNYLRPELQTLASKNRDAEHPLPRFGAEHEHIVNAPGRVTWLFHDTVCCTRWMGPVIRISTQLEQLKEVSFDLLRLCDSSQNRPKMEICTGNFPKRRRATYQVAYPSDKFGKRPPGFLYDTVLESLDVTNPSCTTEDATALNTNDVEGVYAYSERPLINKARECPWLSGKIASLMLEGTWETARRRTDVTFDVTASEGRDRLEVSTK